MKEKEIKMSEDVGNLPKMPISVSEKPTLVALNDWVSSSVTIKLLSVGFLILLLLIPTAMIQSLIGEREMRRNEAVQEISGKWGGAQSICGPVLSIPYHYYATGDNGKPVEMTGYAHFLPENLRINAGLVPELRHRGIYEAVLYRSQINLSGDFLRPDFSEWDIPADEVLWEQAELSVGIPDMRGINERVVLRWNTDSLLFEPGMDNTDVFLAGISARIPLKKEMGTYHFECQLDLNGSATLNFTPLGKQTVAEVNSKWKTPSFDGAFLPDEERVGEEGFSANWKILHLNRNYPQAWRGSAHQVEGSQFGVKLLQTIDEYQKNTRSAKYAVMFIALTFLVFFFVEILNRTRIHPLQYLLVGLALCVFYLLLLSLSEQIRFNWAYLMGAFSTILLITLYVKGVFRNTRLALFMGGTLTVLYGFLYSILQLQDYALIMGSLLIFATLAIVMYLSRNIDWYNLNNK